VREQSAPDAALPRGGTYIEVLEVQPGLAEEGRVVEEIDGEPDRLPVPVRDERVRARLGAEERPA